LLDTQPSIPIPANFPGNSIQPTLEPNQPTIEPIPPPTNSVLNPIQSIAPAAPSRQNFKFSAEQKQIMLEKFMAGLHYPTNAEKEAFAQSFGVSTESVWAFVISTNSRFHDGLNVHVKKKVSKDLGNQWNKNPLKCLNISLSNLFNLEPINLLQQYFLHTANSLQRIPTTH
jgi:hypothetical protein